MKCNVKWIIWCGEHSHQSGVSANFPSILHQEPTFSILQYHFSKTHTLVYLFYNLLYLNNIIYSLLLLFINISISFIFLSDDAEMLTSEMHDPYTRTTVAWKKRTVQKRLQRGLRCGAGQIPSEGWVRKRFYNSRVLERS